MMYTLPRDISEIVDNTFTNHKDFCNIFTGKRILITGACGFLGRYFVETFRLLNRVMQADRLSPCEILAMDNLISGVRPDWPKDVVYINHDITKPFYPERPINYVLYAAGIASPFHYRRFPLATLEVATKGFLNVLSVIDQNTRIVYFSSSEIYGDPDKSMVPTPESYRGYVNSMGPRSCYDESKRLGETLAYIHHTNFDRPIMVVRPFNVYGPGMQKTDYRVLPNFAQNILTNKPIVVYEPGNQTRTFCYITDAIKGFIKVLVNGKPGEAYNIGTETPEVSMLDLAKILKSTLSDYSVEYVIQKHPESYPPDEPQRRCPNISKAKTDVGYFPKIALEEGLQRFFVWAKENY